MRTKIRFEDALHADFLGESQRAIIAYERFIESPRSFVDPYLNLVALYWNRLDPGVSANEELQREELDVASRRYREVLEQAEELFPEDREPEFWLRHVDFYAFGGEDFSSSARKLYDPDTNTVPAFYILATTEDSQFLEPSIRLWKRAQVVPTTKNRFIKSVLESTFRSMGGEPNHQDLLQD